MSLGQIATEAATGGVLKKGVLKNVAKFTEKHLRQSLFNKFTGLRPSTLLKKDLQTLAQVFSCEFCKIFKNTSLQNTSR